MCRKGGAATLLAPKGTKQRRVTNLLEMEQYGLDGTINLPGLAHKISLPTVLRLCQKNELPAQDLLLDNASGQPANLAEVRTPLDVDVVYTPSDITSFFQPTDPGSNISL